MVTIYHRPHRLLLDTNSSSPPTTNRTRPRSSYSNEANFDTNMVIIIAALLCALICTLGLNSMVRCALRWSRRFSFETPDETAARLATTGLKKSALKQIPVTVYGTAAGVKIKATDCPICLGDFMEGERVRVLPKCNHGFHVRCIDTWLLSHSSCPTCRQSLLDQATSSDAAGVDSGIRHPGNSAEGQADVAIAMDERDILDAISLQVHEATLCIVHIWLQIENGSQRFDFNYVWCSMLNNKLMLTYHYHYQSRLLFFRLFGELKFYAS